MKKFTVLVALALLAATGTGYAVTCAYDNVPGATLLVPYFKVSRNGATVDTPSIPAGGIDTLVAITNVSEWGVISHWTVWNKQSAPVVDWNVPLTGYDVATASVRDILNGQLNFNTNTQVLINGIDPCIAPSKHGDTQTRYIRFTNPDSYNRPTGDRTDAEYSVYLNPAFDGEFKKNIWDSLDESYDVTELNGPGANDTDNPACGVSRKTPDALAGDFTGYITIDVVNFCTRRFPDEAQFYYNDAIATVGWDANGGPNVLIGDYFFIDPANPGGNISGEAMVSLEFDARLSDWRADEDKTFYARFNRHTTSEGTGITDLVPAGAFWGSYAFLHGDGREPLGTAYGFRYLNDAANGLTTWATVWRSDLWDTVVDAQGPVVASNLCSNTFMSQPVSIAIFDNDENLVQGEPGGPLPSGDDPGAEPGIYIPWEAQRVAITGNTDIFLSTTFKGGWISIYFPYEWASQYNQAWVGIQHSAPAQFLSVGHGATLLDNQFLCPGDIFVDAGNVISGVVVDAQ